MKDLFRHSIFAAFALAVLSGCGKSPESSQPITADGSSPDGEKTLNLFCWTEYVPKTVIDQFTQETGIHVAVENYSSNEELLAKLRAGGKNYDLIQPGEQMLEGLIKSQRLAPLDHAEIPNLKNIAPEFLNMSFDPGNVYSVPYMAGMVGIVVNTDLIKDDIKSFADVFQDKYKQNIVILDDAREITSWALFTQHIPVNDLTDANLENARPILEKWLPLVRIFDSDSPKTELLRGDVALGVVWNGEGAILLNANKKFKWVIPAEGTHLFVDSLAIPKGAKHVKNAQAFMDFILRPGISKEISDIFPYLNPNLAARSLLTPAQRANPASFPPPEEIARMQTFRNIGGQSTKVDEIVTSVKAQ